MIPAEILENRRAAAPAPGAVAARPAPATPAGADLVRLFGLDRLPTCRQLVCRWQREPDGRLASRWELDIAPLSQR
jgi:hypothetical protein